MTQKEFNENILVRLDQIQTKLPNGEITSLIQTVREMKEDISELKRTLLNPERGVIVKTNKNVEYIQEHEERLEDLEDKILKVDELSKFRDNVTRALWIMFAALVSIVVKILTMSPSSP